MASNAWGHFAVSPTPVGGYDCKFVDPPPDKLVCQICLLVARIPHQVMCCGRVYCKACLDEHKKHSYTCPNCRKVGQNFPDIRGEQEINALKVKCNNCESKCGWVGELQSLDSHLKTCGCALLHCPNKCMNNKEIVQLLRRNLDQHLKNKCPNRQHQCPHCKVTGRYCDITTTHLDTCPNVKIPCPNSECWASIPRCELFNHRSTCEFEIVRCKYAGIGCQKTPLRKDLQQHENDDTFHLHLAIETVNKQQKELKAAKEEQKTMSETIMAGQAGRCVLSVPKFNQHKSTKQEWYSPPFYTQPGGYKMCIRVDANGNGDGENTHVSVFAYLMKGRNDDNLSWPFTGEVTITLLNQLANRNHYPRTTSFLQDSGIGRRVVNDEIAATGYGWHKFISHNQLGYYPAKICQYLKNDSLYIQIDVETPEPVKHWLICSV